MNSTLLLCTLAFLLAGALSMHASSVRAQGTSDDARTFAAAMQDYRNSHWAQSYALLALLADDGHAEAARIASQMHRWGPRLYGQRFPADAVRLERWKLHATCGTAASAPATCALTAKAQTPTAP